jgi:hypothetical protein
VAERGYWSAFPESPRPKVYGEGAAEAGKAAFDALLNKPFPLTPAGTIRHAVSYGIALRDLPKVTSMPFTAIAKPKIMQSRAQVWFGVFPDLTRINKRSFEIVRRDAHHGQAFVVSFQAGCPHAQIVRSKRSPTRGTKCAASPPRRTGKSRRARTSL